MLKKEVNLKGILKLEKCGMAVILYTHGHVHVNAIKSYMSVQWCRHFVGLFVSLEY